MDSKRFALAALALFLAASVAIWAGGGAEKAGGASAMSEEAKTLAKTWPEFNTHDEAQAVCFEMGWTGPEADKDFITPEIARRTNFLFKYEPMTVATQDDLNQKLNLMVASGQMPEIFFGSSDPYTRTMYEKMGKAGMIWNLGQFLPSYKNLATLLKPEFTLFRAEDGKSNYWIPTQTGRGFDVIHSAYGGLYVRDDFLKRLGMAYPTTPDEYYTYLKRCVQEIGTVGGKSVIGFTTDENLFNFEYSLLSQFLPIEIRPVQSTGVGLSFDPGDNFKVVNDFYTDGPVLMRAAKYANRLYREGLVDPEMISHKRAQYQEKVSSGRVASMAAQWWDMNTFSDNAKAIVPDIMFVNSLPLWDKADGVPKYPDRKWTNWIGCYSSLVVSKKVPEAKVKHFLAVLDYFATREGQILVQVGIEGKNFQYDKNGKYAFTDEFKKLTGDLDWNKCASYGVYYYQQFVYNLGAFGDIRSEFPELVRPDNLKGWENQKSRRDRYVAGMDPPKDYYFVEGPIEIQKLPAIDSAKVEMWVKVLQAKSEADVEAIVHDWAKTCKDMGIGQIIAERQQYMDKLKL